MIICTMTWKLKVDIATVSEGLKISLPEDASSKLISELISDLCLCCVSQGGDNSQNGTAHQIQHYSQTYFV